MRISRWSAPLVVLALGVSVLAGCGGGSDSKDKQSVVLKAADVNPRPRAQLRDGGTLRIAVDQFSTQWNFNQLNGPADATNKIISGVMPSPFTSDEHAKITVDPNYASSAKLTATSPKQVVTIRLNPKAKWSDGKPITEKDYEAQWKALRSADGPYQVAGTAGYERIESVKQGADPYEVVITFSKPFGEWNSLFIPLYPASTNSDPDTFNKGWLNKIPVTAGPFKLGKIDQTAKTVTIVRDPKWWGPPAKLDSIVTRALDVDAAVNAFANGEVDVADVGPDPSAYKRAKSVQGGAIREAAGPDFRHITINGTSSILRDLQVRRAVAMAINRAVITKADLTDLNWPAVTMGNHFYVNSQTGYRDNSGELGSYAPDKAKDLLDQDGWKLDGAFRKKGGKTLTLRFVIPSGTQTSRSEGELTQAMLRDVGIKVDLVTVPGDDFFDKYIIPGNFDLTPFSWIGTPFPISSAQAIYAKPVKDSSGELQVQENFARVGTDALDKLMSDAQEELDPEKAIELTNQADRMVWDEVHSLTLYQRPQITAVKASLANYGSLGFKSPVYQDIGFVK